MFLLLVAQERGAAELAFLFAVGTLRVLVVLEVRLEHGALAVLALDVVVQAALAGVAADDGVGAARVRAGHHGLVAVAGDVVLDEAAGDDEGAAAGPVGALYRQVVELVVDNLGGGPDVVGGQVVEGGPVNRADGAQGVRLRQAPLAKDMVAAGDDGLHERDAADGADEVLVNGILVVEEAQVHDGGG